MVEFITPNNRTTVSPKTMIFGPHRPNYKDVI
jgi:hypothetical protein